MIIDNLNLNHLRVFETVYETRSMTLAAQKLHLTQSGVSQHVKSLEVAIGVRLFDRIRQRLVPTAAAGTLFKSCVHGLSAIELACGEIRGGGRELAGTVAIGTPIEFGNNILLPRLAEFCREHPKVRVALRYGFATEMNEGILSGDLDFAFVDAFGLDRHVRLRKVYDEVLHLCASPELIRRHGAKGAAQNRGIFESLEYVDYQIGEPVLRMWFKHHLGAARLKLDVRATVMDVQGVARLIVSGLGAGVLPEHLASKLEEGGSKLYRFKGCGRPLKNTISVAYLEHRTHGPVADALLAGLF